MRYRPALIVDSWAGELHSAYKEKFPHINFHSSQYPALIGQKCHPHGAMVASVFASNFNQTLDVHFAGIMDVDGYVVAPDNWWMDRARDINASIIVCSWGASDGDDQFTEDWLRANVDVPLYEELIADLGCDIFFAAGNSDDNDADVDVAFPQRALAGNPNVHIIGACDRKCIPAPFSSDGEIDCMYCGVSRNAVDPFTGEWVNVDGTSFSAPDAAGDAFARGRFGGDFKFYVVEEARRPMKPGFEVPHPKGGMGSMYHKTVENLEQTGLYHRGSLGASMYHDFKINETND